MGRVRRCPRAASSGSPAPAVITVSSWRSAARPGHAHDRSGLLDYLRQMSLIAATLWGLLGGLAAGLIALSAAVVTAKFEWPWSAKKGKIWPYLFVAGV